MKKEKLAVFDMDGTLFDTREANYRSYKEAILKNGVDFDMSFEDFCKLCFGKNYRSFLPDFFGIDGELMEFIHTEKMNLYSNLINESVTVIRPVLDILNALRVTYYVALWTTASQKNTFEILKTFMCEDWFDIVLTAKDVGKQKPDSEGLLLLMEKLDVLPQNTILFEDDESCINEAKKLGVCCFYVMR